MTSRFRPLLSLPIVLLVATTTAAADPETEEQKTLYAIGASIARNLQPFDLGEKDLEFVQQGLEDAALGREVKVKPEEYGSKILELRNERMTAVAEKEREASAGFLEKAAAEKGAEKTESGLVFVEVEEGTGKSPEATDTVTVHYEGTLRDGTVFDSSVDRGQPATFALNRVIPCWTEGVQKMKPGGKAKLVCPAEIAYGDRGAPPLIKPGATLVFQVELLEVAEAGKAPEAPKTEKKE